MTNLSPNLTRAEHLLKREEARIAAFKALGKENMDEYTAYRNSVRYHTDKARELLK
jgi:hypothetical protein